MNVSVERNAYRKVRGLSLLAMALIFLAGCMLRQWQAQAVNNQEHVRNTRQQLNQSGQNEGVNKQMFSSVKGRPIKVLVFGQGQRTVLVLGGIHGNEPASVELSKALVQQLQVLPASELAERVVIIPVVNPDGLSANTRNNAHQIDLNRNFPTRDFIEGAKAGQYYGGRVAASEPETQAIMQMITRYQPALIIAFHAPMACINYDGPAENIVQRIAERNHFPVVTQFPQPTPGSLGTYYGKERSVPVITLELLPGQRQWERHGNAILNAIGVLHGDKYAAAAGNTISTLPTQNLVICLDAGHPSEVSSGRTVQNGVTEVSINWQVTQRLTQLLRAKRITVISTKKSENEYVTNRQRAEIANACHAALLLRLHCDTGRGSGITFYYPNRSGTSQGHSGPSLQVQNSSKVAVKLVHQGTLSQLNNAFHDNGIKGESATARGHIQGALTGSIFSSVPVITVEMVFLSNAQDAQTIRSVTGQQRMAEALAAGVEKYLSR